MSGKRNGGRSCARAALRVAGAAVVCLATFSVCAGEPEPDPDIEAAARMERAFQKLAQRIAPCVVSLQVQLGPGNWLEELRRMREQYGGTPDRQFEGSGVIVDPAGFVVTNEHVVHGAARIGVKLADGRLFAGEVCGTDPRSDLAMVKLTGQELPKDLPCAELADSDKVAVGQYALAVGNPFGLANTLTVGVVSARGRNVPVYNLATDVFYGNLIQTDAAINPGNSGGPLFDLRGKLIGINTMIFSPSGTAKGCGFAIPSNHLRKRLEYLKAGCEIEYGWLGVRLADLPAGQKEFKVPDNKGVLVDGVIPNTPADRAGLEQGMVVLEFDGVRVGSREELMRAVNETPVGRTVNVKVVDRAGAIADYKVRIAKRRLEAVRASTLGRDEAGAETADLDEDELVQGGVKGLRAAPPGAETEKKTAKVFTWRGLQVKELSAEDGRKRGGRLEIVRVKRGSAADRAGLYEGAIITELKHAGDPAVQKVSSLDEFKRVTAGVSGAAALYIKADGYISVEER